MTSHYNFVLYYLWIAPHVLLAGMSPLFYLRGLHRRFPAFFVYTICETTSCVILFLNRNSVMSPGMLYTYFFIAAMAIATALRFGMIQEVFNDVFRDYERLRTLGATTMRWITALLVVIALVAIVYSSGTVADSLMAGVALLDRSVALIQIGLLLFLLLFSRSFGLSWSSFAFGLALGLGVLASTELAMSAVRMAGVTVSFARWLNLLPPAGYHLTVLIWLGYLLRQEKQVTTIPSPVAEMDRWSGELERP